MWKTAFVITAKLKRKNNGAATFLPHFNFSH